MGSYERALHGFLACCVAAFVVANLGTLPAVQGGPGGDEPSELAERLREAVSRERALSPARLSLATVARLPQPAPEAPPAATPLPPVPSGPTTLREVLASAADGGSVRLSLALSGQAGYKTRWSSAQSTLEVELDGVSPEAVAGRFPPLAVLAGLDVLGGGATPLVVRLHLNRDVEPDDACRSVEGRSDRLDLALRRVAGGQPSGDGREQLLLASRKVLGDGLGYELHRWRGQDGGSTDVHVLRLDPSSPEFALGYALGQDNVFGRERLSAMAQAAGALAAVNASFFANDGEPLGLLSVGRKILSVPILRRTCFGFYKDGRAIVGNPGFSGRLKTAAGDFVLDGVNQKGAPGKLLVYTPEYGASTRTKDAGLELAIAGGRVVALQPRDTPIPPAGFVVGVRGTPSAAMQKLKFWDSVSYEWGLTPPWDTCEFAVGGGPRLVADNEVRVTWAEEQFRPDVARGRAPRTAVGVLESGELVLAVADGRDKPRNVGLELEELARVMVRLGCRDAVNLDGGGSSELWLNGTVANRPSDGKERAVSTALVVTRRQAAAFARTATVEGIRGS